MESATCSGLRWSVGTTFPNTAFAMSNLPATRCSRHQAWGPAVSGRCRIRARNISSDATSRKPHRSGLTAARPAASVRRTLVSALSVGQRASQCTSDAGCAQSQPQLLATLSSPENQWPFRRSQRAAPLPDHNCSAAISFRVSSTWRLTFRTQAVLSARVAGAT
jgi:hypothetical protein